MMLDVVEKTKKPSINIFCHLLFDKLGGFILTVLVLCGRFEATVRRGRRVGPSAKSPLLHRHTVAADTLNELPEETNSSVVSVSHLCQHIVCSVLQHVTRCLWLAGCSSSCGLFFFSYWAGNAAETSITFFHIIELLCRDVSKHLYTRLSRTRSL